MPDADAVQIEDVADGPSAKELAAKAKAKGNAAHGLGTRDGYEKAIAAYSEAAAHDPSDHIFYANMCASYIELAKIEWQPGKSVGIAAKAVEAAHKCTSLAPTWAKGWVRQASAEAELLKVRPKWEAENRLDADKDKEKAAKESQPWSESNLPGVDDDFKKPQPDDAQLATIKAAGPGACEATCRSGLALDPTNAALKLRLQTLRDDGHATDEALDKAACDVEGAAPLKAEGNAAFTAKRFEEAAEKYTAALSHNPFDHIFYSNRSACYAELDEAEKALRDATRCVSLLPSFAKGYSRKSAALFQLGRYDDAEAAAREGLKLDPASTPLKSLLETAQKETCEPPEVQKALHEMRVKKKKDEKLQKMLSGLNLGGMPGMGGMQVFGPGGGPMAGGLEGLFGGMGGGMGGGIGGTSSMSDDQMRQMARAMASADKSDGQTGKEAAEVS